MSQIKLPAFLTAALLVGSSFSHAALDASSTFEVFPTDLNLKFQRDRQSLVVRITEPNGVHREVTNEAKMTIADPSKAKVEKGVVVPVADGQTTLKVEYQGKTIEVPVKVEQAQVEEPVSFRLDVMPVFMKAECNRCHGAARGQDGFRLSLWGFDPDGDHHRLTREMAGRRINLAIPEESMMVTKATGEAPHTGGKLFEKNSELAKTFVRWLAAGAPNDKPDVATPTSLEILPKKIVLESPGQQFRVTVRAHYSDGTDRDVTTLALFLTSNDGAAKIKDGVITTGQRGEAFVMARYATFTVGTQVIVIPKGLKYEWPQIEQRNFIDELVDEKLRNLRITPSGVCSDDTFLRRAYIDITGTLPTSGEVAQFIAEKDTQKRSKKIDELLSRDEFVNIWALKWSELLQIRTEPNNGASYKAVLSYYTWLREQFQNNVPMNEVARQLLSASGSNFEDPAVNFYNLEVDPLKLSEDTAQAFFGIRMQCAQCHNHPFDRWTMEDYYGFVAFFTQVGRKIGEDPREKIVFNSGGGEAKHPVGGRTIPPKFLGGEAPDAKGKDRRQLLADWVASPENPYFPRHIANLVWAQYMGRGIVEPVDDVRISNPASNPELLEALAKKIVEYKYDLRRVVRDICNSRSYQTSTRPNETNELDNSNFAKATIRRMRAEVLLDTISQVTETKEKEKFRGLPAGSGSVEIADGRTTSYFLTTFGRRDREVVCSREEVGPTLSQALHLLNGTTIEGKITQGGVIKKLMTSNLTPREITSDLFLRCFGRFPTDSELVKLEKYWGVTEEQPKAYHDIFWALLNAKEFMFNH
jgi:hypothetical protein